MPIDNNRIGQPFPIGATVMKDGVNFSLFSKNGTQVELLLFEDANTSQPSDILVLDKRVNKTGFYWHIFVPGLKSGQVYSYRVRGPFLPGQGHRFDPQKVLLDPYSKSIITPSNYDRSAASSRGSNIASAMKSVVVDTSTYDWEEDRPPRHPFTRTIIYELHVAGFTKHPNSGVAPGQRGTYAGLIEKIPYLKRFGDNRSRTAPRFSV